MVKQDKAVSDIAKKAGATVISEQEKADKEEIAALQRQQHKRRLVAVLNNGYTVTGVRMSNPKDGHETGMVITFTEDEQKKLVQAIKAVVEARS